MTSHFWYMNHALRMTHIVLFVVCAKTDVKYLWGSIERQILYWFPVFVFTHASARLSNFICSTSILRNYFCYSCIYEGHWGKWCKLRLASLRTRLECHDVQAWKCGRRLVIEIQHVRPLQTETLVRWNEKININKIIFKFRIEVESVRQTLKSVVFL